MQSKRDGLISIGEIAGGLRLQPATHQPRALRKTTPPARRGFTVADQVHQLVSASEADPERGFMGADDGAVQPAPHQSRQP